MTGTVCNKTKTANEDQGNQWNSINHCHGLKLNIKQEQITLTNVEQGQEIDPTSHNW